MASPKYRTDHRDTDGISRSRPRAVSVLFRRAWRAVEGPSSLLEPDGVRTLRMMKASPIRI